LSESETGEAQARMGFFSAVGVTLDIGAIYGISNKLNNAAPIGYLAL